MGFFDVIGNAMRNVGHVGSKFLQNIGNIGSKVGSFGQSVLNFAGGIPFIGGAIRANPLYSLGQSVVSGIKTGSKFAKGAGDLLERVSSKRRGGRNGNNRVVVTELPETTEMVRYRN